MAWTLEEAKDRFSALVDAALAHEPQLVTRRGRPSVVVLSVEDYEHLRAATRAARPGFVEHLLAIPPAADEAEEIPRAAARPRPVEL
jgi:prevent-host-death family protein